MDLFLRQGRLALHHDYLLEVIAHKNEALAKNLHRRSSSKVYIATWAQTSRFYVRDKS